MSDGDVEEIARLTGGDYAEIADLVSRAHFFDGPKSVNCEPRRISDLIVGRQHFTVCASYRAIAIGGRIEGLHETYFFGGIELIR